MNTKVLVDLFARNAPKYGLGNLDVWDLSPNQIRHYLKKFIADLFIEMVSKYNKNQSDKIQPSREDEQIIFELVSAAGFKASHVNTGRLLGKYFDQDGATGETYKINSHCQFKVVNSNSDDYYFATGWLDCAWRVANDKDIDRLKEEIERSIPFAPIYLTSEEDTLVENPPRTTDLARYEHFVDHTKDVSKLPFLSIGIHNYCDGAVERIRTSEKFSSLVCRKCCLRVTIPAEIKTYGELRQHMESKLSK